FCGACGNNRTNRGGFQFAAARLPWFSSLLTYSACVTTPTKNSMVPEGIFESFLLTLAPVVTEHYFL
ncbi:hypothetical protein VBR33_20335, partial [Klebsiella pneumoniae]|nr:hypothetical protein [Klebsiella pneumoniae]